MVFPELFTVFFSELIGVFLGIYLDLLPGTSSRFPRGILSSLLLLSITPGIPQAKCCGGISNYSEVIPLLILGDIPRITPG